MTIDPTEQGGGDPPEEEQPLPKGDMFDRPYVEKLRNENANWRQKFRDKAAETDGLRVDLGLERSFARHGAKSTLTRAYLNESGAMAKIRKIDSRSADFEEQLETLVAETLEQEPDLRRGGGGPPAIRSGYGEPGPGAGPSTQITREEVGQMKPEEVQKALKEGRLDGLLGRGH